MSPAKSSSPIAQVSTRTRRYTMLPATDTKMSGRDTVTASWYWLALAVVCVGVNLVELFTRVLPTIYISYLPVPYAAIPALVLAWHFRTTFIPTGHKAAVSLAAMAALVMYASSVYMAHMGTRGAPMGVLIIAFTEEIIYRFALPCVLIALFSRRVPGRLMWFAAWAMSAVIFASLPGHVDQMSSVASALPFIGFAALCTMLMWRTRSLIVIVALHAAYDLFTLAAVYGNLSFAAREFGAIGSLAFCVFVAYWSKYRSHHDVAALTEPLPAVPQAAVLQPATPQSAVVAEHSLQPS